MSRPPVESRLRGFMLALAACMSAGALVELWLEDHTGGFEQWIPFALCGVMLLSVSLSLIAPTPRRLKFHRVLMLLIMLGGAYGVYTHLDHNAAFERDIRPTADAADIWWHALRGGSPLLAPGIIAIAAMLGVAGTYQHPTLVARQQQDHSH